MTNNIANKKSVCNAALLLLSVCYTGVLQITNKKLKTLCIKDVFIHASFFKLLLSSGLTKS